MTDALQHVTRFGYDEVGKLKMRTKRQDLVVSIYDKASGKILSVKVEVPKL